MSNSDNNNQGRRKAVKSIAAGAGIVAAAGSIDKWGKPIINSVMVPAHAQTSNVNMNATGIFSVANSPVTSTIGAMSSELIADESISEELLEFFMPSANANGGGFCNVNCSIDVNATFTETIAYFCLDGATTGFHQNSATVDMNVMPATCGATSLGPVSVTGGTWNGTDWVLDITTANVSDTVTISPGGSGCSEAPS